jgi:Mor family transcriptional regulator
MGLQPAEDKERNKNLYTDYDNGVMVIDLIKKYQISSQRIYQIVKRYKAKLVLDKVLAEV